MRTLPSLTRGTVPRSLAALALLALGACATGGRGAPPPRMAVPALQTQVADLLDAEEPTPEFYRQRARLDGMGAELDEVLVRLAEDRETSAHVRANALRFLAERSAFGVLTLLRRALVMSDEDDVRLAAVEGLQRFAPDSVQAREALRAALGDAASRVRLTALQGLDVIDAAAIRDLLENEENPQVRQIGRQLLRIFEARGAPLLPDARGDLRSSGGDTVPQIVFHPTRRDPFGGPDVGALWVELPGSGLVPLAQDVEVVAGVVPAFFDRSGGAVVYEADRQILVRNLRSGQTWVVGPGIAPRVVPFTDRFVYLQEARGARRPTPTGGTELRYSVMSSTFSPSPPEAIGALTAISRPDRHRGASAARWMVISELRQGFVLRGLGVNPFILPGAGPPPPRS